jgi:polyribonucleotide nucleotidyltransferase
MPKPEGWVERERKPRPEGGRPHGERPERGERRGGDKNKK